MINVKTLVLPSSSKAMEYDTYLTLENLSALAKITVTSPNSSFNVDEAGVLYNINSTKSKVFLAPFVNPIGSVSSPYAIASTIGGINLDFLYGHSNIPAVSLPSTATSISLDSSIAGLEVLVLPQTDELITISASSIANLPANLTVKVPAGKLSLYQAAGNWKTIASRIIANA
jgi:hypothetical protein